MSAGERPVFVVAGFMRSGTTMMMQALEAGGMKVSRAPKGDPYHEHYELSMKQRGGVWAADDEWGYQLADWLKPYRGRLVKLLTGTVSYIRPRETRMIVVFMRRDSGAISRSARSALDIGYTPEAIDRSIQQELSRWQARDDASVIELNYDDVLTDPLSAFATLRAHGFPIDVHRAAGVIDPARRRFVAELVHA